MDGLIAGGTVIGVTLVICLTVLIWKWIDEGGYRR